MTAPLRVLDVLSIGFFFVAAMALYVVGSAVMG